MFVMFRKFLRYSNELSRFKEATKKKVIHARDFMIS